MEIDNFNKINVFKRLVFRVLEENKSFKNEKENSFEIEENKLTADLFDKPSTIVIDNGSSVLKAGLANETKPSFVFSSCVGTSKYPNVMKALRLKDMYIGNDAQTRRGFLSLKYPIEDGIIKNWDDMELIWYHTFHNQLKTSPEEAPVLLTESCSNSNSDRAKIIQIMFETFKTPSFYLANQAVLSLFASNRTTGIVLDSGDGITHTVPIYEGYPIKNSVLTLNLSGRHLTDYLIMLLNQKGYSFFSSAEKEIVKDIKEKLCYVAFNFEQEIDSNTSESYYILPDGHKVKIDNEKFICPEALFQPSVLGLRTENIFKNIVNSIEQCDYEIRNDLYSNILLSGGSTMFPGFETRLEKELKNVVRAGQEIQIINPEERYFSAWVGGSILALSTNFDSMCVSDKEYYEYGSSIVQRKFNLF